jgi:DNA-binding MarR family transcriptional regulator
MPDFPELNRLIHEPARLAIMATLYQTGEADFLYLKRESNLTQGNLSSHLAKLEEAGYIKIKKTFKGKLPLTLCRLTSHGQDVFTQYCKAMSQILTLAEGSFRSGSKHIDRNLRKFSQLRSAAQGGPLVRICQ